MPPYVGQDYRGEHRQAMIDLLLAVRPIERLADYPGIGDLHELLDTPDMSANTRVWHDADGRLAAFAVVDLSLRNLLFELAPQATDAIGPLVIAWGLERIRFAEPDPGRPLTLDTCCAEDNPARVALLERHGFVTQPERTLRMIRALAEPIPLPQWPDGFRVRHLAGESEVAAYVALHRAAFGTQYMTVENRLAVMRAQNYDPELDLVAVAPDGALAAFCVCQVHRGENATGGRKHGWTDPVGTHPNHRRLGLARALLLTGLQRLKERGMDSALLGTLNTNIAMQRLAESAGFRALSSILWFWKPCA
jgi:ribosomal protein S18 acetylase RimI-like enzyme